MEDRDLCAQESVYQEGHLSYIETPNIAFMQVYTYKYTHTYIYMIQTTNYDWQRFISRS